MSENEQLVKGDPVIYQGNQPPSVFPITTQPPPAFPVITQPPPPAYDSYQQEQHLEQFPVFAQETAYKLYPVEKPPRDYLIFSIVTLIFFSRIIGIVALIKSMEVRNAISLGQRDRANRSSTSALRLNIAGVIIGTFAMIILIILFVVH
ncbi:uncharacterized protein LOC102802427 [Saccoglossus kowalevskii]|uniref:Formin-like protein 14-like n=1 Tax=Saccoglossus kowalevskii TaxID=10224 RepID=A0ABM0MDB6_SACKO|nr:PREDICTED: formin-like protein 14-like [Saccoglossus kowalevskii]